jgi:benzoylformate decarboxylase
MTREQKEAAKRRTLEIAQAKETAHNHQLAGDRQIQDAVPLHFSRFTAELVNHLPKDAIIFDEALTSSPELTRYLTPTTPEHYFLTRGGSLGVGIPGAIGAKLANPDKTVIGFTGDGAAMYTIQALWSAARHHVDAKFVICNNRSYRLLQINIQAYWQERRIQQHEYPLSFDLSKPEINFVELARSMGVEGVRVEKTQEIVPAIQKALTHKGPFLIDVVVEADVHPELIGVKCGQ